MFKDRCSSCRLSVSQFHSTVTCFRSLNAGASSFITPGRRYFTHPFLHFSIGFLVVSWVVLGGVPPGRVGVLLSPLGTVSLSLSNSLFLSLCVVVSHRVAVLCQCCVFCQLDKRTLEG